LFEPALRAQSTRLIEDIVATAPSSASAESAAIGSAATGSVATGSAATDVVGEAAPEHGQVFAEPGVPPRSPLRMEAAAPVYLRPRDALNSLQRMLGASAAS
jgi:hypothetical protein